MSSRRGYSWLVLAVVSVAALILACGGAEDVEEPTATAPAAAPPAATATAPAAATATAQPAATPPSGAVDTSRVLKIAGSSEPVSMYNGDVAAIASVVFQRNLADCIVDIQRGQVWPMLAESWEMVSDREWLLNLRDDVSFHPFEGNPGNKFNAQAMKDHIDFMTNPDNNIPRGAGRFSRWESWEVAGEYEFRFTTIEPNPTEVLQHSTLNCGLHDQKVSDQVGIERFRELGVGTGPYMNAQWVRQEKVTLEKNPDYWWEPGLEDLATAPDVVEIHNIPEPSIRVAALRATTGGMDWIVNPPVDQTSVIDADQRTRIISAPQFDVQVLWGNVKGPPITHSLMPDARFREAMAVAIDKQLLVDEILSGFAQVTPDGWPSTSNLYDPSKPIWPPYDPDRSRELIAELRAEGLYDGSEPIDLASPFGGVYPQDEQAIQAIAAMLEEVGITAQVNLIENVVREDLVNNGTWKGWMLRLPVDGIGDPAGFQWGYYRPGGVGSTRTLNGFENTPEFQEYRRLAQDAASTPIGPERTAKWVMAHEQYKKLFIRFPIYQLSFIYGITNEWEWEPDAQEVTWLARFRFVGE